MLPEWEVYQCASNIRLVLLPAPSCCRRPGRMSPADSGDGRTRSPAVAWLRRSDPVSSVSSGRPRCPESPRCAGSSPDHLRRRKGDYGEGKVWWNCKSCCSLKGFHSHIWAIGRNVKRTEVSGLNNGTKCQRLKLMLIRFNQQWQQVSVFNWTESVSAALTVIVVPLALGARLGDPQQAADGVGGAKRVWLWRLGRGDCRTGDWETEGERDTFETWSGNDTVTSHGQELNPTQHWGAFFNL